MALTTCRMATLASMQITRALCILRDLRGARLVDIGVAAAVTTKHAR
jgi:hypothetical protein